MATNIAALLGSIDASPHPLALGELLVLHPEISRRTAQRWLSKLVVDGAIQAFGEGRSRRYLRRDPDVPAVVDQGFRQRFLFPRIAGTSSPTSIDP